MKDRLLDIVRRVIREESGQVMSLWMAFLMICLLGMTAMVVDIGHAFFSYRELQAATDAAALAGAQALPNSTATSAATSYSAVAGNQNAQANLPGVTMASGYPKLLCLNSLKSHGIACVAPANANAIQVREQVTLPTYFAGVIGIRSIPMTATATASMRGATYTPYNVAIIVDTTASMATADTDCGGLSRLACALQGVQILMEELSPCPASQATCGAVTSGNVANSVDRISLFTFPNVTNGTQKAEYCGGGSLGIPVYSFPPAAGATYAPTGTAASYQIIPYSSDYRGSDTAASLNTGSFLTQAAGGKAGCAGMQDPGGDGTFYAGVLYAAQASLVAEQAAFPGSQNVIIILSDGDATATSSKMAAKTTDGTLSLNSTGVYPSYNGECGQAVVAAKAATAAGTRIYSVAYGSGASGCATDATTSAYKGITPCQTMEKIASGPQYFFSDYNQSGSGSTCQSASQPTTSLSQIFTQIANDFTVSRLIPDGTT